MSEIIKLAAWAGKPRATVIFVHGLGGHPYDTWRQDAKADTFWPLWLAQDVEGLAVYTLGYAAPMTNWLGTAMALQDRAVNLLEILLGEPGLRQGPIIFIGHSLGGLLIKQILLDLHQKQSRRPEAAERLGRITQVVFLATPHTGSSHGSWLDRLRFFAWPSSIARTLVNNDPTLRAINVNYRGLADERRDRLQHRIFYETQDTPLGIIVDEASADPGLTGLPPIPIDADHIEIAKPANRKALQYSRIRDFVNAQPPPSATPTGYAACPLDPIQFKQPLNLLPKLLRIAVLVLVGLIAYKGIQALIAPPAPIDPKEMTKGFADQNAKLDDVKALVQQLLAQSATKTAPGAEQAIGAAIAAADKGAAAGDERMKQALALLQANKVDEAVALFQAVAVDKEAKAKQNAQEAAAAYRNLGAIAGLRDPKRALDAYSKAIENDPNDVRSLLWVGWLEQDRGELQKAEAHLSKVLQLAKPQGQQWEIYWAGLTIGDIRMAQGHLPEALQAYRDSLAMSERLAKAEPDNADWQRNLSVSYNKIGTVQQAQGDLTKAVQAYRDGLAIQERLAQADPGNAGWQRDLTVSYNKIGDVQQAQGHLPEALQAYRDGLVIRERLAKSDSGNAGRQRDLSVSYNKIGDVQQAQGDLTKAVQAYRDGLAIRERLAQADPGNAGWQRDLSVSYEKIGDVQQAQGHLPEALQAYRDGLVIMERLAQADPGNAIWQRDLFVSYSKIGDVQRAQGDLTQALQAYRDGLVIMERLAKADPGNAGWQQDLSVSYERIGNVQQAQGDLTQALQAYRDSLAIRERLAQADPGNAGWQRDLFVSYSKIGDVQQAQGDLPEALQAYRDGLVIRERLAKADPGNAGWQRDLSVSYEKIGNVQQAQGDLAKALQAYRDSLAIRERLAKADPGNAGWQRDVAVSYGKLGLVYRQIKDKAKAREMFKQGQTIMVRMTQLSPDNAQWKQDLALLNQLIAELK